MGPLEQPRSCSGSSEKASVAHEDDPCGAEDQGDEEEEVPLSRVEGCGGRSEGHRIAIDSRL